MECDADGTIRGVNPPSPQDATDSNRRPTKKQKRSSNNSTSSKPYTMPTGYSSHLKLFSSGTLSNAERSHLHVEIYNYLSYLHTELTELESEGSNGRNRIQRVGISVPGVENLMTKMENTFRGVAEFKEEKVVEEEEVQKKKSSSSMAMEEEGGDSGTTSNNEGEEGNANANHGDDANSKKIPMLEMSLEDELRSVVEKEEEEERRRQNSLKEGEGSSSLPTTKQGGFARRDFETLFARLLAYKEQSGGSASVPLRYKEDIQLGRWVGDLRQRMRELTKLGLEYESHNNELNAGSSEPRYEWLTLPISRGRLGLTLSFGKGYFGNNNSGIMITAIDEKSALKEHVNVGDWLMMIDNKGVQRVEDLETGKDKEIRMFKIAKQLPLHGTYLSAERVVSKYVIDFVCVSYSSATTLFIPHNNICVYY